MDERRQKGNFEVDEYVTIFQKNTTLPKTAVILNNFSFNILLPKTAISPKRGRKCINKKTIERKRVLQSRKPMTTPAFQYFS